MSGEQIKKTDVIKLVQRLQEIDNKLCPETSMDVTEYNLIIEQIWFMIGENNKQSKPRVRSRKNEKVYKMCSNKND